MGKFLDFLGPIGSVASSIGSIFGISSARKAQERANEQNIEQSQEARAWAERMSSTAHQREVNDLRAAGLNPILSANAGASTPAAPVAHVESTARDSAPLISSSVSSALAAASSLAQIRVADSQANLNNASADRMTGGKIGIPGIFESNASSVREASKKLFDKSASFDVKMLKKMGMSDSAIRKYLKYAYFQNTPTITDASRKN